LSTAFSAQIYYNTRVLKKSFDIIKVAIRSNECCGKHFDNYMKTNLLKEFQALPIKSRKTSDGYLITVAPNIIHQMLGDFPTNQRIEVIDWLGKNKLAVPY
jgi:hypothetical protein